MPLRLTGRGHGREVLSWKGAVLNEAVEADHVEIAGRFHVCRRRTVTDAHTLNLKRDIAAERHDHACRICSLVVWNEL